MPVPDYVELGFHSFHLYSTGYIAPGPIDLRKGMDQLSSLVQNRYELNLFENCLYIFCNRTRDKLKMLYWDGSGFWLLNKRLEEGKFQWDKHRTGCISITHQQLRWLLEGLSMTQNKAYKSKSFEAIQNEFSGENNSKYTLNKVDLLSFS